MVKHHYDFRQCLVVAPPILDNIIIGFYHCAPIMHIGFTKLRYCKVAIKSVLRLPSRHFSKIGFPICFGCCRILKDIHSVFVFSSCKYKNNILFTQLFFNFFFINVNHI